VLVVQVTLFGAGGITAQILFFQQLPLLVVAVEAVITLQQLEVMEDLVVVAVGIPALAISGGSGNTPVTSPSQGNNGGNRLWWGCALMAAVAVVGLVRAGSNEQVVLAGLVEMERPHPFLVPLLLMLVGVGCGSIPWCLAGLAEQAVVGMDSPCWYYRCNGEATGGGGGGGSGTMAALQDSWRRRLRNRNYQD
jgi:hypothetical protein